MEGGGLLFDNLYSANKSPKTNIELIKYFENEINLIKFTTEQPFL